MEAKPSRVRVKHYPRISKGADRGKPIDEKNFITFEVSVDDVRPLFGDILNRPYKVFDGSVWFPCFADELELINPLED